MVASQADGSGAKPPEADDRRIAIINAKKQAITAFEPKSGPAWAVLVELLLLDTQDVRPHLQELAFRALGGVLVCAHHFGSSETSACKGRFCQTHPNPYLTRSWDKSVSWCMRSCYTPHPGVVSLKAVHTDAEIALITPAFPVQIYHYASNVVTSGDGVERAHAAEVMCHAAQRWPSWPVSQRKGHAVATVDDALLALSVGMQDMSASVRLLASLMSAISDELTIAQTPTADCHTRLLLWCRPVCVFAGGHGAPSSEQS